MVELCRMLYDYVTWANFVYYIIVHNESNYLVLISSFNSLSSLFNSTQTAKLFFWFEYYPKNVFWGYKCRWFRTVHLGHAKKDLILS
jgi:hypothetical protein